MHQKHQRIRRGRKSFNSLCLDLLSFWHQKALLTICSMERHLLYKTKIRQEGRLYVVWWVIKKTLSGNITNLQARAQSCRERRELELVQSKLPHTSASKIFVIFKFAPHKMLKAEKLVLAHFVEVDENRWRVFQSTLVHACLHLFSMLKKKKVFCIFTPMVMSLIMIAKRGDRWIMW